MGDHRLAEAGACLDQLAARANRVDGHVTDGPRTTGTMTVRLGRAGHLVLIVDVDQAALDAADRKTLRRLLGAVRVLARRRVPSKLGA